MEKICLAHVEASKLIVVISMFAVLLIGVISDANSDTVRKAEPWVTMSENKQYLVRIVPKTKSTKHASAEIYKWKKDRYQFTKVFRLDNPISPVFVFLSNESNLLTIENWGRLGQFEVISLYDKNGVKKAGYQLDDLYGYFQRNKFKRTMSSLLWLSKDKFPELISDNSVAIYDAIDGHFSVNLESGDFTYIKNE